MTPAEALEIHANPDGHTGTRWREARAVLEAAVKAADLAHYQERALVTAGPLQTERDRLICGALGLTGEAGEAADLGGAVMRSAFAPTLDGPHPHERDIGQFRGPSGVLWRRHRGEYLPHMGDTRTREIVEELVVAGVPRAA